jgi:hypothetical protein
MDKLPPLLGAHCCKTIHWRGCNTVNDANADALSNLITHNTNFFVCFQKVFVFECSLAKQDCLMILILKFHNLIHIAMH